jgi:hypothetical protein
MLCDEIVGRIYDGLDVSGLSPSATLALIRRRLNGGGASTDQVLKAAIIALREQAETINEQERELESLSAQIAWLTDREMDLESAVAALEAERDKLRHQLETSS